MQFTNQKPAKLDANLAKTYVRGNFEPKALIAKSIVEPLFTPINPSFPATLTVNGQDVSEDDVVDTLMATVTSETVDSAAETLCGGILGKGLLHFTNTRKLLLDAAFVNQAATAEQMDFPDKMTIYTPTTDVIPRSAELLRGDCSYDSWFASLAFFARDVKSFGAAFASEVDFDQFKQWVANQIATLSNTLPPETVRLFAEFDKLTLDRLTESIVLRKDASDGNQEFSFARMLPRYMVDYTSTVSPPLYGLLPFSVSQLATPETLIFVNISRHAQANPREITDEWDDISKALQSPIRVMTPGQIQKLPAAIRTAKTLQSNAANASQKRDQDDLRSAISKVGFSRKAPSSVDIFKLVMRVLTKMSNVTRSQNSYKITKQSFMRPNRRDPDNYNLQGKSVSTAYKPDIHIYLDTSGSISEENYQEMIKSCIKLARKLNVNMYFNSFSHILSQCTLLSLKGRSTAQVYTQFRNIAKVSGGTDYSQIWDYINASPKRKLEFSLIITDFEYSAPSTYHEHPTNLFYAPCSNIDWNYIVHHAQRFMNTMTHIAPDIRAHILM